MRYISRFLSALKKLAGFILFSLMGFFRPEVLYAVTASRPLSRSYWRLLQAFLWLLLAMAILLHPHTLIFPIGSLIAIMPLIILSTSIDPFVSWLRGEDEKPWLTFSRYISQGLWSFIIALQPFILILILLALFEPLFFDVFDDTNPESASSFSDLAAYLIYASFQTIHFIFSQVKSSTRKSHKLVSSTIFCGMFLVIPLALATARAIA